MSLAAGFRQLVETFQELRRYRQALLFLLAFLIYNDGIQTMIRMATIYGESIGIDSGAMITALLLTQFIGVPAAFAFGALASRIGAETGIFLGLAVYAVITRARLLHEDGHAFLCAGDAGRPGAGGHPGAEPVALREHDPAAEVVGVLRVLQRVRALRRRAGTGGLRPGRIAERVGQKRDPRDPCILHRGRAASDARRRRQPDGAPRERRRASSPRRVDAAPQLDWSSGSHN